MPYLLPTDRAKLDSTIDELVGLMTPNGRAGELNYIINRLMLAMLGDGKYKDINELVGAVECAKLEFYRRKVGPYEDAKAKENGDLNY